MHENEIAILHLILQILHNPDYKYILVYETYKPDCL